jgi:hypothetical protein
MIAGGVRVDKFIQRRLAERKRSLMIVGG